MNKKILEWPDRKLSIVSTLVNEEDDYKKIIKDLKDTLKISRGLGLSAPQIGYFKRIFILDLSSYDVNPFETDVPVFINPSIELSGDMMKWKEGCLSVDWKGENIERFSKCTIKYLNEDFSQCNITAAWPFSGILQHEYDHLDGVLYVNHLTPFKKGRIRKKITKRIKLKNRAAKRAEYLRRKNYE